MNKIHQKMLCTAQVNQLPEIGSDKLEAELNILKMFGEGRYIWLLRTSGSTLIPVGVGVNPSYVNHWLYENHGQRVLTFLVDSKQGTIEKITFAQTEKLAHTIPVDLSALQPAEEILSDVSSVLNVGIEHGVWGKFNSPGVAAEDWPYWLSYFQICKNEVMKQLIERAINCLNSCSCSAASAA